MVGTARLLYDLAQAQRWSDFVMPVPRRSPFPRNPRNGDRRAFFHSRSSFLGGGSASSKNRNLQSEGEGRVGGARRSNSKTECNGKLKAYLLGRCRVMFVSRSPHPPRGVDLAPSVPPCLQPSLQHLHLNFTTRKIEGPICWTSPCPHTAKGRP